MASDKPNWDGLLKWSIAHSDGTRPPQNISEEDRRWFMEAMESQTVDVIKRMKEITLVMQTPPQVLEAQDMLDELEEHVESIDMANDLHSIGGLVPLLGFLKNPVAGIRAKAADVVTTIVQNNPKSQQLVMEANGLEPLLSNFVSDPDVKVRTKALGAISSLIRHNRPGIAAFRLGNGYAALKDALGSENVRFQRKALNLIQYLLHENGSDRNVVMETGFPRVMMHLISSEDGEVREAALRGLLELAQEKGGVGSSSSVEDDEKLKQILEDRIKGISSMNAEDLSAAREERQLVDSLWRNCYNEPSSLRERGLLVLPGEDAPPPDVAGKLFEPRLRALAANPAASAPARTPTNVEKKETPLLIGPGPSASERSHVESRPDHNVETQNHQN
ncbi:hsp70 nucleotide exchange factor FES1-like isoform X2 [Aristolochia californica]|uniref:hsp70 nucleotide exchange factor FES1-like isoform X2 n=1 Tax=Aristolochia californica TaxID=171875 RepID=UPI0035E349D1